MACLMESTQLSSGLRRLRRQAASRGQGLSPREAEVLKLLARGLTNQQIVDELFLSRHAVRRHLSKILNNRRRPRAPILGDGSQWSQGIPTRGASRDGQGARVLDVGCGAMGWLRLLSEWVGPPGRSWELTTTKPSCRRPTGSCPRRVSTTSSS